jgi:acyl-CoA thioesterase II
MARSIADHIAVEEVAPNEFVSKFLPERLGVALPIAYGGCTIGVAVHAACLTVSPDFHLYSALGHYLGPGMLNEKFRCTVERVRDTRSFATRRVRVTQLQPGGKPRICMEILADFHLREEGGLTYSAPPVGDHPPPHGLPTNQEQVEALLARGEIDEQQKKIHAKRYDPLGALFDIRQCPDSVAGQNLFGLLKPYATTQDHLPIGSKFTSEWTKANEALGSQWEQVAALAFGLDGGVSTLPLVHSDIRMEDITAIGSLDFALRVMQPVVDLTKWHLHQRSTSNGAGAITYGESRMWDSHGVMVASMSQQSILRLREGAKSSL